MSKPVSIPVTSYRQIYDSEAVEKVLKELEPGQFPLLKKTYEKMISSSGLRFIVKPSEDSVLDDLYDLCPNFKLVIDDLKKYLALAAHGDEFIPFPPLLLTGDSGIGKTYFARNLASRLGVAERYLNMASTSAGWVISGLAASYKDARPGKVAMQMIEGEYANPVFLLDEIDKVSPLHHVDPLGAFYELLEADTAAHFKDEFIDIEIDLSNAQWIGTANRADAIAEPLLKRMSVYAVPAPTREESLKIAKAMYRDLIANHRWGFIHEIEDDALEIMTRFPPREMKKALIDALGTARLAHRDVVRPEDFNTRNVVSQQRMGFV
jgi:ATP-dependent Lon protease